MLKIPADTIRQYTTFLGRNQVDPSDQRYYVKWLRFYLVFCHQYSFQPGTEDSLSAFMDKLREKRQSEKQRKQARHAVSLYFQCFCQTRMQEPGYSLSGQHFTKRSSNRTEKNLYCQENGKIEVQEPQIHNSASSSRQILKSSSADWSELYEKLENSIKIRHYSPATLKTYTGWARKLQTFTNSKDYRLLTVDDVKRFLTWLAVEKGVSASSQNQAFNALLFLFRNALGKEFGKIDGIVRAKRKPYIPVVLSREEIDRIISLLKHPYRLIISLMYGCGLRISECLSLRVHCFNFDMKILTVHDGKGKKDRTVPIPDALVNDLKAQLNRVIEQHERDCRAGYDGVFLPGQLEKKYANAARELTWQWFFPAKELTIIPETGEQRRYHIRATALQKALRTAVKKVRIPKRVTPHTFRHSYASHLLQANYDIRTIQKLLGHSDVRTTMIYTHTVKSVTLKEAKSPLDF